MEPILVIMAAGMGSRYGGNKQIDPITTEGDIIMDFSLYDAYRAGFKNVVFIINDAMQEEFTKHIEQGAGKVFNVNYAVQHLSDLPEGYTLPEGRTKPWGTGHAVLSAKEYIDSPFAVINADDYYGPRSFEMIYDFLKNNVSPKNYCLVSYQLKNTLSENGTVSRGVLEAQDAKLIGIEEHLSIEYSKSGTIIDTLKTGEIIEFDPKTQVSMNLWGFGAEYMQILESGFKTELDKILAENPLKGEYYIQSPVNNLITKGLTDFTLLESEDKWFGVTYKEDKQNVSNKFAELKSQSVYPINLWG